MTDTTNTATESTETGTTTTNEAVTPVVDNSSTVDIKSIIPEDLRDEPSLSTIKDVNSLVKGYVSAQKMLGNRIAIPTKEASKEARDEFFSKLEQVQGVVRLPDFEDPEADKKLGAIFDKLGRPADPTKYKLDVPEGLSVDTGYLKNMAQIAHKAGLTQNQLQTLAAAEFEMLKQQTEALNAQKAGHQEFLKKEWGNAFDTNNKIAGTILQKFTEKYPDHVQALVETGLATNPIIRLLAVELGKAYQETGSIALDSGTNGARTPEMARDEISDIMSNKSHPYHNANDPSHEAAVLKVNKLYQDAYPEPKTNA